MKEKERVCRVCGCTDNDCRQCIEKTGVPCHWVEDDLCSACLSSRKEHPIIFSTPMVQAILSSCKTQTRRIISKNPRISNDVNKADIKGLLSSQELIDAFCPHGKPGDILWVRETFQYCVISDHDGFGNDKEHILYKANPGDQEILNSFEESIWRPSIYMPRKVARIFLEITGTRVERLQDISEKDAIAEGVECRGGIWYRNYHSKSEPPTKIESAVGSFITLWESINGEELWNNNPWVWVLEFKKVDYK